MTIYGYIRVSTDKQTTENQRFEINRFLAERGLSVDKWINETASGTICFRKRRLGIALRRLKKDDVLICSELSRLGRTILDVLTILNHCLEKQTNVWTVKERYILGNDIQSQMLAFVFSMVAQLERALISQRTKEALQRLKAEGKKLGRPYGRRNKRRLLDGKEAEIEKLKADGLSKKNIAGKLKVSYGTLANFFKKNQ
ncbi:MAG TPA: invertase [Alphaproteobacteria bacterium]|nr:invertase [Alphaproteobacteria bacterium]